jgi:hypothetical protein
MLHSVFHSSSGSERRRWLFLSSHREESDIRTSFETRSRFGLVRSIGVSLPLIVPYRAPPERAVWQDPSQSTRF